MKEYSTLKKGLIGAVISIILILIDQITKFAAVTYLKDQAAFVIIDGVFELSYLENRGAAFGILQNQQIFFIIATLLVLCIIAYLYLKCIPCERRFIWLNIIAILFFSGAIGNFIDRVMQNYVVDFFSFVLIHFPIFNVADIYVVVGMLLFILLGIFYYKETDFERILPSKKKSK